MPKNIFEPDEQPVVAQKKASGYNKTVQIQSLFPAHLKYTGLVTGVKYEWPKAGDIVSVSSQDVDDLLTKHIGAKGCCGNSPDGNRVFQILE